MTPDPLDDYLERARLESASTVVPDGFTDRVMRAVRVRPSAPVSFDLLPSTLASGALIIARESDRGRRAARARRVLDMAR